MKSDLHAIIAKVERLLEAGKPGEALDLLELLVVIPLELRQHLKELLEL